LAKACKGDRTGPEGAPHVSNSPSGVKAVSIRGSLQKKRVKSSFRKKPNPKEPIEASRDRAVDQVGPGCEILDPRYQDGALKIPSLSRGAAAPRTPRQTAWRAPLRKKPAKPYLYPTKAA